MHTPNVIEKYKRSEYLREYNEILDVYNSQVKPLKNIFLILFVAIYTLSGAIIFVGILIYFIKTVLLSDMVFYRRRRIRRFISFMILLLFVICFVPCTYFIRLRQVTRHKNRRMKNLEEKKAQAIAGGIYDANA